MPNIDTRCHLPPVATTLQFRPKTRSLARTFKIVQLFCYIFKATIVIVQLP